MTIIITAMQNRAFMTKLNDITLVDCGVLTEILGIMLLHQVKEANEDSYSDIIEENIRNSKSLLRGLKLLLTSKLKSDAKSFIINNMLETNPKSIPTACNDFLLASVKALQKLLWVVKHLVLNVECQPILAVRFQKLNPHMF